MGGDFACSFKWNYIHEDIQGLKSYINLTVLLSRLPKSNRHFFELLEMFLLVCYFHNQPYLGPTKLQASLTTSISRDKQTGPADRFY